MRFDVDLDYLFGETIFRNCTLKKWCDFAALEEAPFLKATLFKSMVRLCGAGGEAILGNTSLVKRLVRLCGAVGETT